MTRERSWHRWRRPSTAATAHEGPFQQQEPIQSGAVRESTVVPQGCAAAVLCPRNPPATLTAGAPCISTCCCWGQRLAGLRCYYFGWCKLCVYWCQMTLQPSRKPWRDTVKSCSSHTLPGPQERVSEPGVAHFVSHVSPGARPQFMTCRVVQGHAAFALQPQPAQNPSPTIPYWGSSTDAERQQDTHSCFSVALLCSLTLF